MTVRFLAVWSPAANAEDFRGLGFEKLWNPVG